MVTAGSFFAGLQSTAMGGMPLVAAAIPVVTGSVGGLVGARQAADIPNLGNEMETVAARLVEVGEQICERLVSFGTGIIQKLVQVGEKIVKKLK